MFTSTRPKKSLMSRQEMDLDNITNVIVQLAKDTREFHNLLFETHLEMPRYIFDHLKTNYPEDTYVSHFGNLSASRHVPGLIDGCPTFLGEYVSEGDSFKMVGKKGLYKVALTADNRPQVAITSMVPIEIPINYTPTRWFSKLMPVFKTRTKPLYDIDPQENQALETLRDMVTEKAFRRYLKDGFLVVTGKSGYNYQIDRNKSHTIIWNKGTLIGEVCIRIKDPIKVPPTDNVIAFKTMIEADEEDFKKQGNFYKANRMAA